MLISAEGKKGDVKTQLKKIDEDPNARDFTDEHGKAEFVIDACSKCDLISIQVKNNHYGLSLLKKLICRPGQGDQGLPSSISLELQGAGRGVLGTKISYYTQTISSLMAVKYS